MKTVLLRAQGGDRKSSKPVTNQGELSISASIRDLTGQKFGRLTPAWPCGKRGKYVMWLCFCECGNFNLVQAKHLLSGNTHSCGCLKREMDSKRLRGHTFALKHGHARRNQMSSEYNSYRCAKQRCINPKLPAYADYGARGIQFKFESFEQFLSEVGPKPTPQHTVDRCNNNGHYEPGNVRWATWEEQAANRRPNSGWSKEVQVNPATKYK